MADKVRELKIHIDAPAPIQRLHDALQISGAGNVKIYLYAHLADGHIAEIELKGKYNIPQDMLSTLQKTPGYVKHSEG